MASIRVDVWRPLRHTRDLLYGGTDREEPFSPDLLLEHVYSWAPADDVWGGIRDERTRTDIKQTFSATFAADRPGEQRGIDALIGFIEMLRVVAEGTAPAEWMTSGEQLQSASGDGIEVRITPTIALLHRLAWIAESFRDTPEVTLTVR